MNQNNYNNTFLDIIKNKIFEENIIPIKTLEISSVNNNIDLEALSLALSKYSVPKYQKNDSDEWKKTSSNYLECKNNMELLENEMKNLKDKLIELSNGQNCHGNGISLTKTSRKGNINYKEIPELNGIDLEKYRSKNIEYYTISQDC